MIGPDPAQAGLAPIAALDLDFECHGVHADRYAAGPTVVLSMRAVEHSGARVHALLLRTQIRIEPLRRRYDDEEAARLSELFGERGRWGTSMKPMQLAFLSESLPGFEGEREFELRLPCSYDVDVAGHKYLAALDDDAVPLLLLFSGTVFSGSPGALHVLPVPWHKETAVRMPVSVWQEAMDAHFPNEAWLRLPRPSYRRLAAYRSRHGLVGWEQAVERLLDEAGEP